MYMQSAEYKSMDEYIGSFPGFIQEKLTELRKAIREQAPEAREKISYNMPTFYLDRNLVHFAAYEKHIGFYPTASGIEAFKTELSKYKSGKGSVQFPLDEPLPFELIKKIVRFRVKENTEKKEKNH